MQVLGGPAEDVTTEEGHELALRNLDDLEPKGLFWAAPECGSFVSRPNLSLLLALVFCIALCAGRFNLAFMYFS